MAVAVHSGHQIRGSLLPWLAADDETRRRDEDPVTDIFASVSPSWVLARQSRFEVDLNRPPDRAMCFDPGGTWGIRFWTGAPPDDLVAQSRELHAAFYASMQQIIDHLLAIHGRLLVLDVHSYNFRRAGPDAPAEPQERNPDIDLGITELDWTCWGDLVESFAEDLRQAPLCARLPDVRYNVKYPDGGYFPRWVRKRYGPRACPLTVEYKKVFMDEWTGEARLDLLEDLRVGMARAVDRTIARMSCA